MDRYFRMVQQSGHAGAQVMTGVAAWLYGHRARCVRIVTGGALRDVAGVARMTRQAAVGFAYIVVRHDGGLWIGA
ncbi:hypothetical protein DY926_03425 [Komagataeibacter melaceti]|uniref:Uncharacterized protein n=2 Tax=Komagataeibacter melaceti TaxID=2766577 RepID=A0A371Z368_9PROT|nr:hypothetical protein DY926_03425 [Komagataeibacter melaceti]